MSPNIPKFPKNSCDRAGLEIVLVSKQIGGEEQALSHGQGKGIMSPYLSSLSRDTRLLNKSLEPVIWNGFIRGDQELPGYLASFGGARWEAVSLSSVSSQFTSGIMRITYPSGWSEPEVPGALVVFIAEMGSAWFRVVA